MEIYIICMKKMFQNALLNTGYFWFRNEGLLVPRQENITFNTIWRKGQNKIHDPYLNNLKLYQNGIHN